MPPKSKAKRRPPPREEFSQGGYSYDDDDALFVDIMSAVLQGLLLHGNYDESPKRVGQDAARIAEVLEDEFDKLAEDFDEDAADYLARLMLGTIPGAVMHSAVDSIREEEASDVAGIVVSHAKAAWLAFEACSDSDDEEEEEDGD